MLELQSMLDGKKMTVIAKFDLEGIHDLNLLMAKFEEILLCVEPKSDDAPRMLHAQLA